MAIPSSVANRAVEIPAASWLAWGEEPSSAITRNAMIMPYTVPTSPIIGPRVPTVAR